MCSSLRTDTCLRRRALAESEFSANSFPVPEIKSAGILRRFDIAFISAWRSQPRCDVSRGEEHDRRQRADEQHVPHIVPGHSCARLVRALHNTIVFAVRHFASLRRLRNASRSGKQRRPPAAVPPLATSCPDANVECAQTLPEQRHAVKTIFLGILT